MSLHNLLARLERTTAATPVTPEKSSGVTRRTAPIKACTHVTHVTPENDDSQSDLRKLSAGCGLPKSFDEYEKTHVTDVTALQPNKDAAFSLTPSTQHRLKDVTKHEALQVSTKTDVTEHEVLQVSTKTGVTGVTSVRANNGEPFRVTPSTQDGVTGVTEHEVLQISTKTGVTQVTEVQAKRDAALRVTPSNLYGVTGVTESEAAPGRDCRRSELYRGWIME